VFVDDMQRERYDSSMYRKVSEHKYVDIGLLQSLYLWNDLHALFVYLV